MASPPAHVDAALLNALNTPDEQTWTRATEHCLRYLSEVNALSAATQRTPHYFHPPAILEPSIFLLHLSSHPPKGEVVAWRKGLESCLSNCSGCVERYHGALQELGERYMVTRYADGSVRAFMDAVAAADRERVLRNLAPLAAAAGLSSTAVDLATSINARVLHEILLSPSLFGDQDVLYALADALRIPRGDEDIVGFLPSPVVGLPRTPTPGLLSLLAHKSSSWRRWARYQVEAGGPFITDAEITVGSTSPPAEAAIKHRIAVSVVEAVTNIAQRLMSTDCTMELDGYKLNEGFPYTSNALYIWESLSAIISVAPCSALRSLRPVVGSGPASANNVLLEYIASHLHDHGPHSAHAIHAYGVMRQKLSADTWGSTPAEAGHQHDSPVAAIGSVDSQLIGGQSDLQSTYTPTHQPTSQSSAFARYPDTAYGYACHIPNASFAQDEQAHLGFGFDEQPFYDPPLIHAPSPPTSLPSSHGAPSVKTTYPSYTHEGEVRVKRDTQSAHGPPREDSNQSHGPSAVVYIGSPNIGYHDEQAREYGYSRFTHLGNMASDVMPAIDSYTESVKASAEIDEYHQDALSGGWLAVPGGTRPANGLVAFDSGDSPASSQSNPRSSAEHTSISPTGSADGDPSPLYQHGGQQMYTSAPSDRLLDTGIDHLQSNTFNMNGFQPSQSAAVENYGHAKRNQYPLSDGLRESGSYLQPASAYPTGLSHPSPAPGVSMPSIQRQMSSESVVMQMSRAGTGTPTIGEHEGPVYNTRSVYDPSSGSVSPYQRFANQTRDRGLSISTSLNQLDIRSGNPGMQDCVPMYGSQGYGSAIIKKESSPDYQRPLSRPGERTPSPVGGTIGPHTVQQRIRQYLTSTDRFSLGLRVAVIMTPKVAQKSYNNEHRFICPAPSMALLGRGWCLDRISGAARERPPALGPGTTEVLVHLDMPDAKYKPVQADWVSIDKSGILSNASTNPAAVAAARVTARDLHIPVTAQNPDDAKTVHAVFSVGQAESPTTRRSLFGHFKSSPVTVVSKPAAKAASGGGRNASLNIRHGSMVSVFNRVRSQTIATRFLGMKRRANLFAFSEWATVTDENLVTTADVTGDLRATALAWEPLIIWVVNPQEMHVVRPQPPIDGYPVPPPGVVPFPPATSPLWLHYNMPVIFQSRFSGACSPVFILRATENAQAVGGGNDSMLHNRSLLTTAGCHTVGADAFGGPIKQLSKVALERWTPPATQYLTPRPQLDDCPCYLGVVSGQRDKAVSEDVVFSHHEEGRYASNHAKGKRTSSAYQPASPGRSVSPLTDAGPQTRPRSGSQGSTGGSSGYPSLPQRPSFLHMGGSWSIGVPSSGGEPSEPSTAVSSTFSNNVDHLPFDSAAGERSLRLSGNLGTPATTDSPASPSHARYSEQSGLGVRPVTRPRASTIAALQSAAADVRSVEGGKKMPPRSSSVSNGSLYGAAHIPRHVDATGRRISTSGPRPRSASLNSTARDAQWRIDIGESAVWTMVNVDLQQYACWVPPETDDFYNGPVGLGSPGFEEVLPPRVDHVRLESSCNSTQQWITIHGENLQGNLAVYFDAMMSPIVEHNPTQRSINAVVPAHSPGQVSESFHIFLVRSDGIIFPTTFTWPLKA